MASKDASTANGDIVSMYPKVVGFFVFLQLCGWVCTLFEVGNPSDSLVAFTTGEMLFALDISLCQVMFYGTLHNGPVSDERLKWICRVAFVVDGVVLLVRGLRVFRPTSVANYELGLNMTLQGLPLDFELAFSSGLKNGTIYFLALAGFSNILGVAFLSVSRLRIVEWTPKSELRALAETAMKAFALTIGVQVLLGAAMVIHVASLDRTDAEQIVRATKLTEACKNFSTAAGQITGYYFIIFGSCGQTISGFLKGEVARNGRKGTWHKVVAIAIFFAWQTLCLVFVLLALLAESTTRGFDFNDLAMGTLSMHNGTQFTIWFVCMHDFEFTTTHMRSMEKGEARVAAYRRKRGFMGPPADSYLAGGTQLSSSNTRAAPVDEMEV